MDETVGILFAVGLILFVFVGPWVFVWRSSVKRKRDRAEDQARWGDLTRRIFDLELAIKTLKAGTAVALENSNIASVALETPPVPKATEPLPEPTDAERVAQAWIQQPAVTPVRVEPLPALPQPSAPPPPPAFAEVKPHATFTDRFRSTLGLEETLGTNWLNKLGVVILVLGIVFFLAYQLKTLGPAGKVLVGYAVGAVALGLGIWFERSERYRILARSSVCGGWGLLFFTTFAMYHVAAAHVLNSQPLDLMLMLPVAGVMVWHTLRYRSQVVTGLLFVLAFLLLLAAINIDHSNVYSLVANALLAGGLIVIVLQMQWFELELLGILACYLNHYFWLRPIIEPMNGHHHPFPEFAASVGILSLYWAIFRLSYVFRKVANERQEHISTAAALLNTVLLLALFKYQSAHPEWAFWALLAFGAIEIALGQLPITRRRRNAVVVLCTIGVVLLVAAFPFRYSGARLSVLWLMEAEALLLIGVWTREVIFRRLGLLAAAVVAGQMLSVDAARVMGMRFDGADVHSDFQLAIVFALAAAIFYFNAHWAYARWTDQFGVKFDRRLVNRLSYAGAVMLLVGAWIAFPEAWTAVAWGALGLGLALVARRLTIRELEYQSLAIAVATVIRVLSINLETSGLYHGVSLRLVTIGLAAGFLYLIAWVNIETVGHSEPTGRQWLLRACQAQAWAASALLALMAWYELRPVGVAVAWGMGGLVLLEFGVIRKSATLRLQAYVAFMAAFLRIFYVNLNASGSPGEISPRFYTVVPLALAFFYGYWRIGQVQEDLSRLERKLKSADLCCYLGTITIASLMRFELEADWVATAWAGLAFVLLALAWRTGRAVFLHQGLLLAFGILFRTSLHNFYQRSYFPAPPWESRWLCVGATVLLLIASLPFALRLRKRDVSSDGNVFLRLLSAFVHRPEQVFFFIAVGLLTVLLALEMRHGMVTVSWGVEAVAVFLLALWLEERSFRLTGLGLLLLSVGKILVVDVWGLNPRDRYLTFIVMGSALLLVSFLYTRYREALRQYL